MRRCSGWIEGSAAGSGFRYRPERHLPRRAPGHRARADCRQCRLVAHDRASADCPHSGLSTLAERCDSGPWLESPRYAGRCVTGFVEPFDTWADMSRLIQPRCFRPGPVKRSHISVTVSRTTARPLLSTIRRTPSVRPNGFGLTRKASSSEKSKASGLWQSAAMASGPGCLLAGLSIVNSSA